MPASSDTRILITGTGAICAAGQTPAAVWQAVCRGYSALGPITRWDAQSWAPLLVGEVKGVEASQFVPDRKLHKLVRRTDLLGLYAATAALSAAGVPAERQGLSVDAAAAYNEGSGVFVGADGGAYENQYDFLPLLARAAGSLQAFGNELTQMVHPMWLLRSLPNNVLCHVGIMQGFKGANACIANHSASGALALVEAAAALRAAEVDRAVVVAHQAPIEPERLRYYDAIGLLTTDAVRPFDAGRSGCALGEGAAALMLATGAAARTGTVPPLGEYLGGACVTEGEGLFDVRDDGDGVARAIALALTDADLTPEDVGFIVAHGNATTHGDAAEVAGLLRVFGDNLPPVTAFKWSFGHCLAAAGLLDAVLALSASAAGTVPGVASLRGCPADWETLTVSPHSQRPRNDVALVISRGFAGINVAFLLRALPGHS